MKRRGLALAIPGMLIGMALGIGVYTFVYAQGSSYLVNDPASCANCHIMRDQYDGWTKSSHHNVATCNDCHTPDGLLAKYATKASNGFWHSYAFTTGDFHEPIRIKARNLEVTDRACRKCHEDLTESIDIGHGGDNVSCLRCHRSVGHMH
ncbi:MAG: cytochrome c nitrite reductase small subunit [Blastocatellales bacterium]